LFVGEDEALFEELRPVVARAELALFSCRPEAIARQIRRLRPVAGAGLRDGTQS